MWLGLVVIPREGSFGTVRDEITAQLERWQVRPASEFEKSWPTLRRELERKIQFAVEQELRAALLGLDGHTQLGQAIIWQRMKELSRPLPW
jgi:hypothetical protein